MRHHRSTNLRGTAYVAGNDSGGEYKSKLERDGLVRWLSDPDVRIARLQQPRTRYRDEAGKVRRYTGDLLVEFHGWVDRLPLVIEFKYRAELEQRPELGTKHDAVSASLRQQGKDFLVQTEEDVYAPGFEMMKFVYSYRNNDPLPQGAAGEIIGYVSRNPGVCLSSLISALRAHRIGQMELIPEVWRLVALHRLTVDFKKTLDGDANIFPASVL